MIRGCSHFLAPVGQLLTHAVQRIQEAGSVATTSPTTIAAVGQARAQSLHCTHKAWSVMGDTSVGGIHSLYG
jgi:hypothetical protein